MAHQTAVDIIRVISEAVNPTGQFAYLRTWDASLEFNEVDQKIFLYPISGQVDITNGYFETWNCSMGFFFQDAPDSTNEQREQLITNADVLIKAFILAADTVDGVQFSIVRKRPVYRDMAGTYSGYLVDFTLSLTEDICNGDTPSVIIPVGKTFCELVDECLGISVSGDEDLVLNQKGEWVQGGGGAVDSVNGQTGAVVLGKSDIGLGNIDNTSDVNKPVSTAQAAADTAVLNASKSYADGLVTGLLDDRGNYDASTNLFPSSGGSGVAGAILKGDLWTVNVAGTLGGVSVTSGDIVRALTDSPGQTASNWAVSENNIGYVAENQANKTSTMAGNEASTSIYLSAKGIYDWATSVFTTTSAVALQIATALANYVTNSALALALSGKQDTLVSATNIKTVNGNSILGSGDLVVSNNLISRKGSASSALTGTTVETILESVFVASGVVSAEDIIEIKNRVFRATGTAQFTIRHRINTTNSISGSLLLGAAVVPNGSFRSQGMERTINFRSGNTIEVIDPTSSIAYENATTTQPNSSGSFTYSSGFWLLITGQLTNAADNLVNSNYIIQKF